MSQIQTIHSPVYLVRFGFTPRGQNNTVPTGTDYRHEPRFLVPLSHPFVRFGPRPQGTSGGPVPPAAVPHNLQFHATVGRLKSF